MLDQLRAATTLSDALARVFTEGRVRYRHQGDRPALVADLDMIAPLMQAWLAWLQVEPSGDDWHAPYKPPSEIRIPPLEDEPAADGA